MSRLLLLVLLTALMAAMVPSAGQSAAASWRAPSGAIFDSPEHGWQTACDEAPFGALRVGPAPQVDRLPPVYGTAGIAARSHLLAHADQRDGRMRIRRQFHGRHVPRMISGDPPGA